jgi:hypothetical protein
VSSVPAAEAEAPRRGCLGPPGRRARGPRVLGGAAVRPCCRAHVLRDDVAVPGRAGRGQPARESSVARVSSRRVRLRARSRRRQGDRGCARGHARAHRQRELRRARRRVRDLRRPGDQRCLERLRGGGARAQRDLRGRGGPRVRAAQAGGRRHDARRAGALRRRARRRLPGGGIVEDIATGSAWGHTAATVWRIVRWPLAIAGRRARLRARLRVRAVDPPAALALDLAGRGVRRLAVAPRLGRLRGLPPALLALRRGVRHGGRRHRPAALDLPVGQRLPARRAARRGPRAPRGRRGARPRAPAG